MEKKLNRNFIQRISGCNLQGITGHLCKHIQSRKCSLNHQGIKGRFKVNTCFSKLKLGIFTNNSGIKLPSIEEEKIIRKCGQARFVAMKLLRYDMVNIVNYIRNTEDNFLIHLIRDPRGIIHSHIRLHKIYQEYELQILSKKICGFMKLNLEFLKSSALSLRQRVQVLRYEDFAKAPLVFTTNLYKVLSITGLSQIRSWITSSTSSKSDHGLYFRHSSNKTAFKWKTQLSVTNLSIIDEYCSGLYKYFEGNALKL